MFVMRGGAIRMILERKMAMAGKGERWIERGEGEKNMLERDK
jgi:hypothetical protein